MNSEAFSLDTERFLHDLHELRKIGAFKTGVHRPTYSADDMESRRWLIRRMEGAGLEPIMDGIGNVLGRSASAGPRLLVGSQNEAGWLNGALGVMAGVALARQGSPATSSRSRTRRGITDRSRGRGRSPGC